MSNQWRVIFFVLILVLSLPGSVIAAGPVTTAQHATDPTSSNTTETSEPPDPQPIQQSSTSFDITPTADNETIPWRQDRLPVFVGDTVRFQAESTLDGYELVNVSWKTSGPANVTPTTENGSTALTQFETHGKTTLQVTTTLHNELFDRTIEQSSTYTLIATSDNFAVDEFSVSFEDPPSRWDTAAVYAHLHDVPEMHHNLSQRLPLPPRVNLAYMTYSEIQDRCGEGAYACVDQSNENTIYMPYDVGKYEAPEITTYRHELTHVAQFHGMDMSYRQQWRFIVEGHAEYEQSNQFNRRPLDEKPSPQELRAFQGDYHAAELFVSAFVAEYGYQSLRQMIELSRDSSVDQAIQKVTNESFNSFVRV
ncbi:hypothetical protein PM022_18835 [Halorubrum ezzemoulense]|uniref:hypothetical protein n=1 Tax=Halorubrum ezzemoulense TaxID=337243 RepID=UPI00232FDF48|nr:hypothetical protein [Halorubrum ezzemoulense]MDB2276538.1 hypothetical protein [Halorubrum ezzemoulense]